MKFLALKRKKTFTGRLMGFKDVKVIIED